MEKKNRLFSALGVIASAGQLLCLFPFIVLTEGLGFGEYVWWHYLALYAVYAAFMLCGRFCGAWANGGSFTSKQRAWAVFASRAAVIVPSAAFIIVCACTGLPTSLYFYAFPGAVIAFFGGRRSAGLGYSDILTIGWFGAYFAEAVAASFMLWLASDEEIRTTGLFQLCIMFGVIIVMSAVLANQTNIDVRTRQRSSGKNVLPKGLRGYNAALIAGVCAAAAGLFLFAKPAAELITGVIAFLINGLFSFLRQIGETDDGVNKADIDNILSDGQLTLQDNDNTLFDLMTILLVIGVVILLIRFRKQILELFRELFAPLFKEKDKSDPLPFADEVSDSLSVRRRKNDPRKTEQQLLRSYRRENDPVMKYRKGYLLFMLRLDRTAFPCLPSDTTTAHGKKGTLAFRRSDIDAMVGEYNAVRYGGKTPDERQLAEQERLLNELY